MCPCTLARGKGIGTRFRYCSKPPLQHPLLYVLRTPFLWMQLLTDTCSQAPVWVQTGNHMPWLLNFPETQISHPLLGLRGLGVDRCIKWHVLCIRISVQKLPKLRMACPVAQIHWMAWGQADPSTLWINRSLLITISVLTLLWRIPNIVYLHMPLKIIHHKHILVQNPFSWLPLKLSNVLYYHLLVLKMY